MHKASTPTHTKMTIFPSKLFLLLHGNQNCHLVKVVERTAAMLSSQEQVLLHFSAHLQHFCHQIREVGAAVFPWNFHCFCKFKQHAADD